MLWFKNQKNIERKNGAGVGGEAVLNRFAVQDRPAGSPALLRQRLRRGESHADPSPAIRDEGRAQKIFRWKIINKYLLIYIDALQK